MFKAHSALDSLSVLQNDLRRQGGIISFDLLLLSSRKPLRKGSAHGTIQFYSCSHYVEAKIDMGIASDVLASFR
jgi:hypothetical protein